MAVITIEDAKTQGLKRYYTGEKCKLGHKAQRFISNKQCIECSKLRYAQNAIVARKWREDNPERNEELQKRWYQANKERVLKKAEENYDPVKRKAYQDVYYANNKSKFLAQVNRRRGMKLNATPFWSEKALIEEFYKNCPEGHEVDHIVPFTHDKVCGLHVLANLQYLTRLENRKKKNKFTPGIYETK